MSNEKIIKNPNRNVQEKYTPYVPQYQILGKEPIGSKKYFVPNNTPVANNTDGQNPRIRQPSVRQPYAEAVESHVGRGKGPVPNVGNNMEYSWSGVDNEIIDDISDEVIDLNHPMIDNNEYIEQNSLEKSSEEVVNGLQTLKLSEPDEYLLFLNTEFICSGSLDMVQQTVQSLIFGDHEICNGEPISPDNIMVLKKVNIKIGVFLE